MLADHQHAVAAGLQAASPASNLCSAHPSRTSVFRPACWANPVWPRRRCRRSAGKTWRRDVQNIVHARAAAAGVGNEPDRSVQSTPTAAPSTRTMAAVAPIPRRASCGAAAANETVRCYSRIRGPRGTHPAPERRDVSAAVCDCLRRRLPYVARPSGARLIVPGGSAIEPISGRRPGRGCSGCNGSQPGMPHVRVPVLSRDDAGVGEAARQRSRLDQHPVRPALRIAASNVACVPTPPRTGKPRS